MICTKRYDSPLGEILLAGNGEGLTGLWFAGQKYFAQGLPGDAAPGEDTVLAQTCRWLDRYFAGEDPGPLPPLAPRGTHFRREVWDILLTIPRGDVLTYGDIAARLAQSRGIAHFSAQAVGGAVGHNPVSILIPCHRVVGRDGSLTGYAGGLWRKEALLALERGETAPFAQK
ncbi:MAG: methylated-DNA--[protein]-cysteine S-methyltransferase [Clostridia bacterium]|nr:methylated-DNA--[protein]-cysteine S-methyltransferase [Clostridia bacterium]MDD7671296.1 methylated-DNA--[protein]-cysteine S-methyltransferase [Clostridia bacterium]MDY2930283.1 methylated-DNA--[protein]-cysteine S-methyltransferase [Clostridiaceae bacterium]